MDPASAFDAAVRNLVSGRDVCVAFSGGIDSALSAAVAGRYARSLRLYTVGTEDSYDVLKAESMASRLGMDWERIPLDEDSVVEALRSMIRITGTVNPLVLSFEIPPYMVCASCPGEYVLGGQGSDELFAGYSKYKDLSGAELEARMAADRESLEQVTLPHEEMMSAAFGKTLLYPFMDPDLIDSVRSLGTDAVTPSLRGRKALLKDIASELGFGFLADTEKKAAQYGSGAMDLLHSVCRKQGGIRYSELVERLAAEIPPSARE